MRTARDQGWQTQNQIKMLIRMRNREQNLIYREENKKIFLKILIIKERTRIWVISLQEFLEIKTLVKVWSWCSVHFHCDHCDCCDLLPISCYLCKTTSVTHDTVGGCPTNKSWLWRPREGRNHAPCHAIWLHNVLSMSPPPSSSPSKLHIV